MADFRADRETVTKFLLNTCPSYQGLNLECIFYDWLCPDTDSSCIVRR